MTNESLTSELLTQFADDFAADRTARIVQNAVTETPITKVAMDRKIVTSIDPSMSVKVDRWPNTNQKKSGRCWLFSGLNSLKPAVYEETKLANFEFSQNYMHFWDKLEKANFFLTSMMDLADRDIDDRTVHYLLHDPIGDGGQWNMFVALVQKYGVVPKYAMPETESSSNTREMNSTLENLLRRGARDVRAAVRNGGDVAGTKRSIMEQVYRVLNIHLGTPPQKFLWQWEDKDHEFHREGEFTPLEFAAKYVGDLNDYVCLVNDPRESSPYNHLFTVDRLGNVVGAKPVTYLNVPIQVIRDLTQATLEEGHAVWMGCDTGKQCNRDLGIWDEHLYDFDGTYGIDLDMTKAEELQYGQAMMTHAMVFTGVDLVNGKPRRWRIENSWGDQIADKGFFTMNDSWFDQHVFEVAIHKSKLSAQLLAVLDTEPIVLPAWDPMGSLARA
ncbi:MAG: C1 family peptidase [Ancrocorticia sp.]|jgi:bleomycin hydrolase|nr:C1 family peptidase [Ancrocorticia sp.]MCI1964347.1 C1 family peptidase [Ancrocorticia sp.]MCI2002925.1 C1 family peptidase [Ancrocorticia sp.]MCI2012661.1 C1 family peptidase [Ancrocorticia sp.]MCI2029234.1 C1 family peptidase [Ancrocorticia sp.]